MTFRLDIHAFPGHSLLGGGGLQQLQEFLRTQAPSWAEGLHVWRYRKAKKAVDLHKAGTLEHAIRESVTEDGPLLPKLREKYGSAASRVTGSVELRGSDSSLIVIVGVDEQRFARLGDEWRWGNSIAIQICRTRVEKTPSVTWAREAFEVLCDSTAPWYAHAEMTSEYDSKNISREGGGMRAVGLDVSRALPGLYWLNFFGSPYRDAIGEDRLLKIASSGVKRIDDGVLVELFEDPEAWESPGYQDVEREARSTVGEGYFFTKATGYGSAEISILSVQ